MTSTTDTPSFIRGRGAAVFVAAIVWKVVLLGAFSLPVPTNDAYFFDGAVVSWLRGGAYTNSTLAAVFPTSAEVVFSAYPPLYQAVLAGWMSVAGPSLGAAQTLHLVLFVAWALLVLRLLVVLRVPEDAVQVAGWFLFAVTFHDRPDSLAHVLGVLSLLAWVRERWWCAAGWVVLVFLTSLHVGALYGAVLGAAAWLQRPWEPRRWLAAATAGLVPLVGLMLVAATMPTFWRGFTENLRVTPALTGWRFPELVEVLKAGRNLPGLLLAIAAILLLRRRGTSPASLPPPAERMAGALVTTSIVAAAMVLFAVKADYVHAIVYLQVPVVALGAWLIANDASPRLRGVLTRGLRLAAWLAAIRAVGLSTWGVAAAFDVSATAARELARVAVQRVSPETSVAASSAYLYDLARGHRGPLLHSDWMGPPSDPWAARPALLVVTANEFYRTHQGRLQALVAEGRAHVRIQAPDLRIPPPDRFRSVQRIVQHLSWAPVVVELEWRDPAPASSP